MDGLSYSYDYTPSEGRSGCPGCYSQMQWLFLDDVARYGNPPRWLCCEDCAIICDSAADQDNVWSFATNNQ